MRRTIIEGYHHHRLYDSCHPNRLIQSVGTKISHEFRSFLSTRGKKGPPSLKDILKNEKLKDMSNEEISHLWMEYHQHKVSTVYYVYY
jgi:ATP11 protein